MAIIQVYCPILGAAVTRVTDLEDRTLEIICAEYDESTALCRHKIRAHLGGPLSQLLERVADSTLASRGDHCILR